MLLSHFDIVEKLLLVLIDGPVRLLHFDLIAPDAFLQGLSL